MLAALTIGSCLLRTPGLPTDHQPRPLWSGARVHHARLVPQGVRLPLLTLSRVINCFVRRTVLLRIALPAEPRSLLSATEGVSQGEG